MRDEQKTKQQLLAELNNLKQELEAKRRMVESALKETENKLSETQRVAKLGYYIYHADTGNWTNSEELDRIFEIDADYQRDESGWLQIVHPEFREIMADYMQNNVLGLHQKFDKEYKIIGVQTGEEKWVHGLGDLKFDQDDQVVEMFGTIQDITLRKQTEEALRKSEAHYRDFFDKVPVALWEEDFSKLKDYLDELTAAGVTDLQAYFDAHPEDLQHCASLVKILDVNQATIDLMEAESKEQIFGSLDKIFHAMSLQAFQEEIIALYEEGGVHRGEIVNMTLTGKPMDCFAEVKIVAGYEETWERCLVSITDISTRVKFEKALKKSEAKMRSIFRAAPIGIGVVSNRILMDVNDRLCEMLGYSPDELIGKSARILYLTDEEFEYVGEEKYRQISISGSGTVETHFVRRDGEIIDVLLSSTPIDPSDLSVGVAFTALDITERKAAQQTIVRERDRAQQYLDISAVMIMSMDKNYRVQLVNPKCAEILGYPREDIIGMNWVEQFVPQHNQQAVAQALSNFLSGAVEQFEYHENFVVTESGEQRLIAWNNRLLYDREGKISGILSAGEDVTERKRAEKALADSEERLRLIVETTPNGITVLDSAGNITFANPSAEKILGISQTAISKRKYNAPEWKITKADGGHYPEEDLPFAQVKRTLQPVFGVEHAIEWPNGKSQILSINASPLLDEDGEFSGVVASLSDITDRKIAEKRLQFLATHDTLTEVPNRLLFIDRLEHAIWRARRSGGGLGVLFVDLDGFKSVNDAFGHAVGDELLKRIARRIEGALRSSDTVARVGGDEFLVLLEDITRPTMIAYIAQKILDRVSAVMHLDEYEIFVTASIGISVFPENGDNAAILLQHANTAMYRAKNVGKNAYIYFSDKMVQRALERLSLSSDLRHALKNDELVVHYQPQVDIDTGKLLGVEALLRWQHPELGFLLPNKFISLAEDTGLIVSLGEWVMRKACQQLVEWHKSGWEDLRLSVNLSEREIRNPALIDKIEDILQKTGLEPRHLELEVTENVVFQVLADHSPLLNELQEMGVRLSLDDFGSGYSTLHQLTFIPFNTLKIDYVFATEVITYPKSIAIVSGVVDIANNLGMDVIGEGIESRDQLEIYRAEGCRIIQGHYFSPAVPPEKLTKLIKK